ncbi:MAG: FecR domain-containing protein [Myxococcaceae bacterium]|nr:FecR domain-containing protein [Myxococcaceae bacterium]
MLLFAATLAVVAAEPPETWVVKPGDTCASIAAATFGDPKRITELHRWNALGPLPHNLAPGQVLRLRAPGQAPAGPDATLTFLRPAVRTRRSLEWTPATLGMSLFRLDEVNTLRRAGAALRFRDESTLVMDENALVVIYGDAPAPKQPGGVSLVDGELRLALSALRQKALTVATSAATVEPVAKTEGVVTVDGSKTSRVSVFEGGAQVVAAGSKVTVPSNSGTRIGVGLAPEAVTVLPDTPVMTAGTPRAVVWRGPGTPVEVGWEAAARATRYRLQVARDELFVDRVDDQVVSGTGARVLLMTEELLRLRVIAFDERGLQSRPSKPHALVPITVGGVVLGDGLVRHRAPSPLDVKVPAGWSLQVQGAPAPAPLSLPVGRHLLRVLDSEGVSAGEVAIVVSPRPPVLRRVGAEVVATFQDALPDAPAPALNGAPMTRRSALLWVASQVAAGPVELTWDGQALVRAELQPDAGR